jgi:hypothetical protein
MCFKCDQVLLLLLLFLLLLLLFLLLFLLLLLLWGLSAYASGSTSALWLIVLSPYLKFQHSPPVPSCHAP